LFYQAIDRIPLGPAVTLEVLGSEFGDSLADEDASAPAETDAEPVAAAVAVAPDAPETGELSAFEPVWVPAPALEPARDGGDLVVFGAELAAALRAARPDRRVVPVVAEGPAPDGGYVVDQRDRAALGDLLRKMTADGIEPAVFVDATSPAPAPYPRLWALACALVDSRRPGPHRLLAVLGPDAGPEHLALGALLRTVSAEVPALRCRAVSLDTATPDPAAVFAEADDLTAEAEVRHRGGRRLVRRHRPVPPAPAGRTPVRRGGSYLIAGAGRIGLHVADWLAREHRADLTLAARSAESPEIARRIAEWRALGVTARYVRADLTSAADVTRLTDVARRAHGRLDGVFHCAGVVDDAVFFRKRPDRSAAVLAAKTEAVALLDAATAADDLGLWGVILGVSYLVMKSRDPRGGAFTKAAPSEV
ncbi:SDR family oxidoreductase, partial [Streptomyces goshikiensis]